MTTPKLRFPGFTDSWQAKKLGDITKWSSGGTPPKDIPRYWNGDIPWISAVSMRGRMFDSSNRTLTEGGVKSGSKIAKQGSILLLVRGSMLFSRIPIGIAGKDVAFNQDVKAITSTEISHDYLYYLLKASQHRLLSQVVGTGIGAGKLDTGQLQSMEIHYPKNDEQKLIVDFLTALDKKSALIDSKVKLLKRYKKGVTQKIFTQRIRFKNNIGRYFTAWEEMNLNELGVTYNGLTGKAADDFGKGSNYITYKQIFDSSIIDISRFKKVHIYDNEEQNCALKGDIFFTTSSETPDEVGFSSVLLDDVDDLYLNSFCFGFRPKRDTINAKFAQFLFRSVAVRRKIMRLAQGSTRYNLSKIELMKVSISLPSASEQQKVADLLTSLDNKIKAQEIELDNITKFKKALLQKMFV